VESTATTQSNSPAASPSPCSPANDDFAWSDCGRYQLVDAEVNALIRDAFAVNYYDSGVSYVGQANEDTQFPLEYRDLSTPRGRILSFGHCTAHGTSEDETSLTTIQTNKRKDWYTADPRSEWEDCSAGDDSYMCSKDYDFQETLTHELTHGFGTHHPQEIDDHQGGGTSAQDEAICDDISVRATICPSGGEKKITSRRVTAGYDHESLDRTSNEH
jgi:hypothetical protein